MKNLAGNKNCDEYIKNELDEAKIPIFSRSENSEVPYTIVGNLRGWTFKRGWYYWIATADKFCEGLPLSVALKMHNKEYPDEFNDEFGIYGNSIRVGGHCGCPSPEEYGCRNGFVRSYHIDSQEGLNEFVRVLDSICIYKI